MNRPLSFAFVWKGRPPPLLIIAIIKKTASFVARGIARLSNSSHEVGERMVNLMEVNENDMIHSTCAAE